MGTVARGSLYNGFFPHHYYIKQSSERRKLSPATLLIAQQQKRVKGQICRSWLSEANLKKGIFLFSYTS